MSQPTSYLTVNQLLKQVQYIWSVFKAKFKYILLSSIVFGVLGIVYAFVSKPTYQAHLSFVLNENEGNNINLSSLAGLAGLGTGNIGGGVNEDKLVFLTNSRFLLGNVLLSKADFGGKQKQIINALIDKYELKNGFEKDTLLQSFDEVKHQQLDSLTKAENKVIDIVIKMIIDNQLLKVESKKKSGIVAQNSGIVIADFTTIDEELSKNFMDNFFQLINTYYVNRSIQRQQRNYNLIKERADSLQEILYSQENYGASLVDQNANLARMVARVKVERTRKNLELLNLMYAEVMKNLEIAKFSLENQTPLLQMVDRPTYPLKVEKKSKIKMGLLFGLIGGVLYFGFSFLALSLKGITPKD